MWGKFPWLWEDTEKWKSEREMHWKLLNTPKATWGVSKLPRAGGWESTWTRGFGQCWVDSRTAVLTLWTAGGSSLHFLFLACLTQPLSSSQEGADSTSMQPKIAECFFWLPPHGKWNLQVSSAGAEQAGRAEWLWDTSVTPSCVGYCYWWASQFILKYLSFIQGTFLISWFSVSESLEPEKKRGHEVHGLSEAASWSVERWKSGVSV